MTLCLFSGSCFKTGRAVDKSGERYFFLLLLVGACLVMYVASTACFIWFEYVATEFLFLNWLLHRTHEWEKHGTCSGMEEHEFFSKVLSLFDNGLNYGAVLNKYGIVPSHTKTYEVCLLIN